MFKITGGGSMDLKVGEQLTRVTRILAGDQGDLFKNPQGSGTDIFQVADRGGDQI
jgi:hypothetical protein